MQPLILPDREPAVRTDNGTHPDLPPAVVLIGCGAVARLFYQPALQELARRGELRVAALVDPSATARAALATFFPAAETAAMLEEVKVPADALAIIASPPRFHAAQTYAAFARGWHVLCEKPMAATAGDCERMALAAATCNRLLAVGLYKRFFPASVCLRELCRGGILGPLRAFDVHEGGPFRWPAATPSFFSKSDTPGGVMLDIGVHVLDLLLWWLGEPASMDYADDAMGGLEANALLRLTYASGATGRIQLSRDWKTRQSYRFEFEKGLVEWGVNAANALTLHLNGLPAAIQGTLVDAAREPAWTAPQCFIAQLRNVVSAVRGIGSVRVTGEDGTRVMQLIEHCYLNRRLLDQPWLEPREAEHALRLSLHP